MLYPHVSQLWLLWQGTSAQRLITMGIYFSQFSDWAPSMVRFWWDPVCGWQTADYFCALPWQKEGGGLVGVSLIQAWIPSMRFRPHDLSTSQRLVTSGVRMSTGGPGVDINIQSVPPTHCDRDRLATSRPTDLESHFSSKQIFPVRRPIIYLSQSKVSAK